MKVAALEAEKYSDSKDALLGYLDGELAKIPDPVRKWATRFTVGAMAANPRLLSERAASMGILDGQGMVDTELVRAGFAMAFREGATVELFGLSFSASDGDELVRLLEA